MTAPKLPSFFKSKGPKQFSYKPWFYDPNKEERDKRNRMIIASAKEKTEDEPKEYQPKLHEKWRLSHSKQHQMGKSNFRLLVIIALLLLITYYLLK